MEEWEETAFRVLNGDNEIVVVRGWAMRGIGIIPALDEKNVWLAHHLSTAYQVGQFRCNLAAAQLAASLIANLTNWVAIENDNDLQAALKGGLEARLENLGEFIRGDKHVEAGRA